jgi:hypothetical protein
MRLVHTLIFCLALAYACDTFNDEMSCQSGDQTDNPEDWADRVFQTPMKGEKGYLDSYEDLGRITCFADVTYAGDKHSANLDVVCKTHSEVKGLEYSYDGGKTFTSDGSFAANGDVSEPLKIVVRDDN